MCEEVQNPAREVPKAIFLSVAAAGITGLVYLIPLLFVMPEVQILVAVTSGQPIALLFKIVTGSAAGGFGLLFLILGILFFAGTGALTASSRTTYAFARDGAIPGHRWFGATNEKLGIPLWGLVLSTVVDALLGLIYFGSTAAFGSFTGVATICLSCGYGLPILVSVLRGRKMVKHSTFSLGRWGYTINIICLLWIALAIVIFCMPVSLPVAPSTMYDFLERFSRTNADLAIFFRRNYASVVFAGFATISVLWYFVSGRNNFTGPPVVQDADPTIDGKDVSSTGDGELGLSNQLSKSSQAPVNTIVHSK
jgi:amino acid transporter